MTVPWILLTKPGGDTVSRRTNRYFETVLGVLPFSGKTVSVSQKPVASGRREMSSRILHEWLGHGLRGIKARTKKKTSTCPFDGRLFSPFSVHYFLENFLCPVSPPIIANTLVFFATSSNRRVGRGNRSQSHPTDPVEPKTSFAVEGNAYWPNQRVRLLLNGRSRNEWERRANWPTGGRTSLSL